VRHLRIPLIGRYVGFQVATATRFCTGRYRFVNGIHTEYLPCPDQEAATHSAQCQRCAGCDEFRFVHHFHVGGYAPDPLLQYMAQPHWVYIATFADGSSKVGTAADARKQSRIDEQGAVAAAYVARAADGRAARILEDAVTRDLTITQFRRRAAKVAALASPMARHLITANHTRVVEDVVSLLGKIVPDTEAVVTNESWHPPAESKVLFDDVPSGGWHTYRHDLRTGGHGLFVDACAGPALLVRTYDAPDATRFVVDMGSIKGLRVLPGEFVSPESVIPSPRRRGPAVSPDPELVVMSGSVRPGRA
jgi:hypothetical protein